VLSNLAWFAVVSMLLFAVQGMNQRLLSKKSTIKYLAQEISWQRYAADKARVQVRDLPELQFLARAMETKNAYFYGIAKAAWKYGRALEKWQQVPNGPALVMSIVHRESAFKMGQQSYTKTGRPIAYGPAQIHYAVWKDRFGLELEMMDDPDYSIKHAVEILLIYLDQCHGNVAESLWLYWGKGKDWSYPPMVLKSKYFDTIKIDQTTDSLALIGGAQ